MCIVFKDTLAVARLTEHTSCVSVDKGGAVSVIVRSQVFVKVVSVLIMNKRTIRNELIGQSVNDASENGVQEVN